MYKRSLYFLLKRLFRHFERLGVHILLVHYHSPIPEIGKLRRDLLERISDLLGIDMNEGFRLQLLEEFKRYRGSSTVCPFIRKKMTRFRVIIFTILILAL